MSSERPIRLWHRRGFIAAAGLALGGAVVPAIAAPAFAAIETALGGRLGVAAWNTHTGARALWRADERFAMCSTFKWLLAAAVLAHSDDGRIRLDQHVTYARADLPHNSPSTLAHLREGAMTVSSLCEAAVDVSDNGAANLLLRLIGGPPGLTTWLRGMGDSVTRLDRMELACNENLPGDPRDTTTPAAMVATMNRILLGDVLERASRERLREWMKNCRTGFQRLRAGLPKSWTVADKTGTGTGSGPTSADNDLAVAWPPERTPILIASYISGSSASIEAQDATHAKIGRMIANSIA